MSDWSGGLPPAAHERVERQRASGVAGSLLSAPGAAAIRSVGLRPVGEVFGSLVMQLAWAGGGCGIWNSGLGGGFGPGGFGPGGFGRGGFGPGGDGPGRGSGRGRGGRRPRGNVRAAILALLAEEPRHGYHGYAIMTELTKRSGGLWRPSPGSVYPVLQQLQDEGLITAEDAEGGRKVFSITDAGAATVQENPAEHAEPWAMAGPGQRHRVMTLFQGMGALGQATQQVAQLGTDEQVERAREALDEARRRIYRILAEDEAADPAAEGGTPEGSEGDARTEPGDPE